MIYIRSFFTVISLLLLISAGISCKDSSVVKNTDEEVKPEIVDENESTWLAPSAFAREMKKSGAVIIDLGFPADFEQGHIEDAININFFEPGFQAKILELDKNKKYFIYSNNESRTKRTGIYMKQNGFTEIYTLKGGWEAWKENEKK